MKKLSMPLLALLGVFSAPLHGAIAALDIDFRDASWAGVEGSNPFTMGNVTVGTADIGFWQGSLTHSASTGLGINSYIDTDPDEVGGGKFSFEILRVDFGSAETLTGFWVSNFFGEPEESPIEIGLYDIGSDFLGIVSFSAAGSNSEGEQFISFGGDVEVGSISFGAPKHIGSEFSLVGFDKAGGIGDAPGAPVPDGGTSVALLGMGLFGLGLTKRLKK